MIILAPQARLISITSPHSILLVPTKLYWNPTMTTSHEGPPDGQYSKMPVLVVGSHQETRRGEWALLTELPAGDLRVSSLHFLNKWPSLTENEVPTIRTSHPEQGWKAFSPKTEVKGRTQVESLFLSGNNVCSLLETWEIWLSTFTVLAPWEINSQSSSKTPCLAAHFTILELKAILN